MILTITAYIAGLCAAVIVGFVPRLILQGKGFEKAEARRKTETGLFFYSYLLLVLAVLEGTKDIVLAGGAASPAYLTFRENLRDVLFYWLVFVGYFTFLSPRREEIMHAEASETAPAGEP